MLNRQPVSDLRWTCPPGPAIRLVKWLVGMRVGCRLCCCRLTYSAQRFSGLLPHFNDCSNYCGLSGAWWDKCLSCNKSPLRVAFQFDEQVSVCVCVQGVDYFGALSNSRHGSPTHQLRTSYLTVVKPYFALSFSQHSTFFYNCKLTVLQILM